MVKLFLEIGEYAAAGMFEEPERSLFYRKALGLRRFYENCELAEYHGEALYPSGIRKTSMGIHPAYLTGMEMDRACLAAKNPQAADIYAADFERFHSSVPKDHVVGGDMWTHSMPHYERILREGLLSSIPRIERITDADMREGLLHVIEGVRAYRDRAVAYLTDVGAERKLIDALKKVPLFPAENLYEALVAWNFVLFLDGYDNLGCVAEGLYPYYNGEDVTDILRNLFDNLDANGGWSTALSIRYNPLTLQCLEASKGKRRPMIELFVDETTPKEIWQKAFEVIRSTNGQPAFYNPHVLLDGLQRRFPKISDEDIKLFCGGGCTESMISGHSNVGSHDAGINLPLILEQVMRRDLLAAESFDAFYDSYITAVTQVIDSVTAGISQSQKDRARYVPQPMRTLLVEDCIERALDFNNGGARYQWSQINFAGIINVIDSLLVIRDLVYREKTYTAAQLLEKIAENDEDFIHKVRNHPVCFGKDNEDVNRFTKKLTEDIFSKLDGRKPYFGEGFLPSSVQFNSQVRAGRAVGATPDGRKAGVPLCDSIAAIFGKDTSGPTALLKSAASLDQNRMLGVPILNFNINPQFCDEVLKALILGYMKLGGIQMQITCISREMLEEAYRNPEEHKNLVVRVGGYSEYFYRLSDEHKRMVINRTIQSGV